MNFGDFSLLLWVVIGTALLFDFVNGWNDSANAIATVVGTKVLTPLKAVMLAAVLNMAGAFAWDSIAKTIGKGLVETSLVSHTVLIAAMSGAIIWAGFMTLLGMPISGSHSLIGGLFGAAVAKAGVHAIHTWGLLKVLLAMLISPLLGFVFAFFLFVVIARLFGNSRPRRVNKAFGRLQICSAGAMAFTHGTNDAQKVMGVITLALVLGGHWESLDAGIPLWVKFACGLAISLGTALGGWKVIKTLGHGLSRLQPAHGFAAETSASFVLLIMARLGVPVSTTHTITGSVLGVGATRGKNAVRWGLGAKILWAWVLTLPATALAAGAIYWILWAGVGMDHNPNPPWRLTAAVTTAAAGESGAADIRLEWSESKGAEHYEVYRRKAAVDKTHHNRSKWKKLTETKETSCTDRGVETGRRWEYKISAVNEHGPSQPVYLPWPPEKKDVPQTGGAAPPAVGDTP